MSRYHPKSPNFGKPVVKLHLEAATDKCICPRLAGCGGIVTVVFKCPEHGGDSQPIGTFHTHPLQAGGVNRGRHVA